MSTPTVPAAMRPKHDSIAALIDSFSGEHLNEEYREMCLRLLGVLARKRPSPLVNGTAAAWACGIVRTIGRVNFLDDKSLTPYMKTADVDKAFGVSNATGAAKSKTIRDMLKIDVFDPAWTIPSRMKDNPLASMIMVNGLIVDVRSMPREIQEEAVRKGIIPAMPEADQDED
ncbi:MAG TPA: DUF6398 domain-containing protein [Humisphaera sp.]|jgi:hypothetical protein|nr:DUF6398 domain-containing protein [Humisphaera sp.]